MNCSSDWEKLLKFEAKGREFAKKFSEQDRTILVTKYHTITEIEESENRIPTYSDKTQVDGLKVGNQKIIQAEGF